MWTLLRWVSKGERALVAVAITVALAGVCASTAAAAPVVSGSFGSPAPGHVEPQGVAVSQAPGHVGHWYVADPYANRVVEYAPDGVVVNQFGGRGAADGRFVAPYGVAVDALGRVYVTDAGKDQVQRFSADGAFEVSWGTTGNALGQFNLPNAVAVRDLPGDQVQVYVADTFNHRIQRFSADGGDAVAIGGGTVQQPTGVAYNPLASVLVVVDSADDQVHKFGPDGAILQGFGTPGSGLGELSDPLAVAIGPAERVYVAENGSKRVQSFAWNGSDPVAFDGSGSAAGALKSPTAVAVDSEEGVVAVADGTAGVVRRFSTDGAPLADIPTSGRAVGHLRGPQGVAVDTLGRIYVADAGNNRLQRFPSGSSVPDKVWGSAGSLPGQFVEPQAVAVDAQGRVYVADWGNHRVQRFPANSSTPDKVWGSAGPLPGQFVQPRAVAVDAQGRVYVADSGNHRVQRFPANSSTPDKVWGSAGSNDGEFSTPSGVAVDAKGRVYVADTENNRVQRFPAGSSTPDKVWGTHGPGPGQFDLPSRIDVDGQGRVYVADAYNNRVQRFTADGAFIDSAGGLGLGTTGDLFNQVGGVAVNRLTGTIYATSTLAGRVNVFDYRPQPACVDGKDNDGDGKSDYPADIGCVAQTDTDETGPALPPANREPDSDIRAPKRTLKHGKRVRLLATASDPDGAQDLARVRFALVRKVGRGKRTRCYQLTSPRRSLKRVRAKHGVCPRRWIAATGSTRATLKLKRRLPAGRGYTLFSQAIDRHGRKETVFTKRDRNKQTFRVRH